MRRIFGCVAIGLVAVVVSVVPAFAQTFSSGSTGADGAFTPPAGVTTLTLPPNGVFNFTTVTIAANATVKVTRNATNTPVTMLASGNVTIAGVIDISGAAGGVIRFNSTIIGGNGGPGGAGGFDGGSGAAALISTIGGSGLGAGGGTGSSGQSGGGAGGAGHLEAKSDRCTADSFPVHRSRERRHRSVLLPGALLPGALLPTDAAAVYQRGSDRVPRWGRELLRLREKQPDQVWRSAWTHPGHFGGGQSGRTVDDRYANAPWRGDLWYTYAAPRNLPNR